ncbi:sulfurtransferase TusA family protein [Paenibacillus sp. L3-i20]|uniref:sulfurtransferase TusA family protein n=1 Tax=Paenibacillus sp. L3-i20 TaxID=2905833 RepID=UPI001EE05F41|nr:sulfurtransferase TusA family protein [Paenibacillus sp. L3-i20]GKU77876.1 hypothetical protein L3i20_v222730 [Paenibacillus sp. L3-i20]
MTKSTLLVGDITIDCKGLACPMPIIRTKKAIEGMLPGQVLEVQATDKGSLADLQAWSGNAGHHYLGTAIEGEELRHFVRKSEPSEMKQSTVFPDTITNDELELVLSKDKTAVVLDVREAAEYVFNHLPGAISIPLGQLENRFSELNKQENIYVICRTGTRSDLACQLLAKHDFTHIKNVLPGMSEWKGSIATSI